MTNEAGSSTILPSDEMTVPLTRVRQLDPTSEEAAVRGYLREMAEAEALIDTMDLGDAPLSVSFSASWPEGSAR
jgi:hypothetical protein